MAIQIFSCQLDWIYDEDMFVLMISYYLECFIPHQETTITYAYLYRYLCTCRADHLLLPPWINNQHSSVKRIIITYLSFFRQSLLNFYFYNKSNRWSVQALSVISFTFFYRKSLSWRHFFPMLKIALHNFEP